ncbi:type II secretion system secretin GspD [Ramlibacter sp. AW1]|uniref:Type II secretion system secretin GspD n=1 Tax=Ramlibacter aurantiacus TaxID=2801330 RepID=A0A937D939_9BURK|nr:type II secretion system secretin GspD [Ramlibacter aurantiacus]MBL0422736.1 type II secretion system secretin GspD [Ramlibacter aurantiacus]
MSTTRPALISAAVLALLATVGPPVAAQGQPSVPEQPAAAGPAPAAAQPPAQARPAQPRRPGPATEPVTLNFNNAEIEAVARTMAAILGRNIVVDPRVRGTISLSTEQAVSPQRAYNQFLAALRLSGFTVVESAGLLKVVPEADAKLQAAPVAVGQPPAGNQIVTQIFRLNYENANNLVPVLRPLISPNNTINVNPGTNSLIITDYADNLQRLSRIVAALDLPASTDVEVIPLQYAAASDVAPVVQRLLDAGVGGGPTVPGAPPVAAGAAASTGTVVLAEPRSNSLIVRAANPARMNLVRSVVQRLDQSTGDAGSGNIHVVYLRNAEAARLAVILRAALAGMPSTGLQTGPGGAPIAGAPQGGASAALQQASVAPAATGTTSGLGAQATAALQQVAPPVTGGQIQADPASNALIITAPEPIYRQLRAVIDQLDQRRAQVYVESLIAEVNADKAAEFGVQWQNILGNISNSLVGVLGTNYTVGGSNIIGLQTGVAAGATLPAPGLNLGLVRNIDGRYVLAALARFLESNAEGNVLSTPNLLTLDNEEARIVIGQNVPFVTGQFTNAGTGAGGAVNPFQTIERKDVGLTLRVRPQISENGTVKMQIYQEVSSVQPGSINSATGLITNKRSIESNVVVDDGGIVVLGGLLQDEYANNVEKIPGVGDVPVLGRLFKSESRSRRKTNLMVFLRPVVLRDHSSTVSISLDRYELMRMNQQSMQPSPSPVLPIGGSPVMPPAVIEAPGAPPRPFIPATPSAPSQPDAVHTRSGAVQPGVVVIPASAMRPAVVPPAAGTPEAMGGQAPAAAPATTAPVTVPMVPGTPLPAAQ